MEQNFNEKCFLKSNFIKCWKQLLTNPIMIHPLPHAFLSLNSKHRPSLPSEYLPYVWLYGSWPLHIDFVFVKRLCISWFRDFAFVGAAEISSLWLRFLTQQHEPSFKQTKLQASRRLIYYLNSNFKRQIVRRHTPRQEGGRTDEQTTGQTDREIDRRAEIHLQTSMEFKPINCWAWKLDERRRQLNGLDYGIRHL